MLRETGPLPPEPASLAVLMVRDGLLTRFWAEQFLLGKWRGFTIGQYKVLERLGSGRTGSVYLCEEPLTRKQVALKILPPNRARNRTWLERFYQEARALAASDHPNVIRASVIFSVDETYYIAMEYVDGPSFQEIVKREGAMNPLRACHYICQAATGLQYLHETVGLIHCGLKPDDLLVDRTDLVKIIDLGEAYFLNGAWDTSNSHLHSYESYRDDVATYLAPEQAISGHNVDIRADIYSLGMTFYFLLTGQPPFGEGTVAQKLIWHQLRQPKPIRSIRPDVPEELAPMVEKMTAKQPDQRYSTAGEVVAALERWTRLPIPPL
jgi:serine/threonine protein kinase